MYVEVDDTVNELLTMGNVNMAYRLCKCKITCLSPHFKVVDDVLYNADMTSIISCLSEKTSFTIPSSVKSIGFEAFYHCESLQQITIPSSVISIGDWAFYNCHSLRQIIIPQGSRTKFEEMLPEYKNKLIEKNQIPDDFNNPLDDSDDLPL